jgi:hypothetical protein
MKHVAKKEICTRDGCQQPAFYDKDFGSFGYCSPECRDESVLKKANEDLKRALKEFETIPQTRAKMSGDKWHPEYRNSTATEATTSQTAPMTCSTDDLLRSITCGLKSDSKSKSAQAPTMQKVPPDPVISQPKLHMHNSVSVHVDKGILDSFEQTTFFDHLSLVDHIGNTGHGVLLSVISFNEETLSCDLRPLDLVTHVDGKAVKNMATEGSQSISRCCLIESPKPKLTVARTYNIPPMKELGRFSHVIEIKLRCT